MEILPENNVESGKTTAIISYITIIALVLNNSKKNSFASFHIRQMIGLNILQILNTWIIGTYISEMASSVVGIGLLVLWVIGFMGVMKGEEKKVPIVGDQFQEWFKNIG